ncbi:hypothetical protein DSO57_1021609 [Entomophthora muscae]|uniref:Uncharacterized protein n=1 Tax=Entomophthora muscae TaxID=34485 RepID=A0ACC2UNW4_9FUNG|nr:hypothetical protein DSO57_1021609 [Entomophthora muscae]
MEVSYSAIKCWAKATKETVVSSLARNRIRRAVILGVVLLVWCSIFIPIIVLHLTHQERDSIEEKDPHVDALVWAEFRGLIPKEGKLFLDLGTDMDVDNLYLALERRKIDIGYRPHRVVFPAYAINNRDWSTYPFDEYKIISSINATDAKGQPLIISFDIDIEDRDFIIGSQKSEYRGGLLNIEYTFQRRGTVKYMCLIIFALIWLLSLAMVNIAIDTVVYRRDTPANFILAGFTIVFALPTLRKSQPGIPDFGCVLDLIGFFWGVAIISSCGCLMLYFWALRWKSENHCN